MATPQFVSFYHQGHIRHFIYMADGVAHEHAEVRSPLPAHMPVIGYAGEDIP
jgi:hypothetical protein